MGNQKRRQFEEILSLFPVFIRCESSTPFAMSFQNIFIWLWGKRNDLLVISISAHYAEFKKNSPRKWKREKVCVCRFSARLEVAEPMQTGDRQLDCYLSGVESIATTVNAKSIMKVWRNPPCWSNAPVSSFRLLSRQSEKLEHRTMLLILLIETDRRATMAEEHAWPGRWMSKAEKAQVKG